MLLLIRSSPASLDKKESNNSDLFSGYFHDDPVAFSCAPLLLLLLSLYLVVIPNRNSKIATSPSSVTAAKYVPLESNDKDTMLDFCELACE